MLHAMVKRFIEPENSPTYGLFMQWMQDEVSDTLHSWWYYEQYHSDIMITNSFWPKNCINFYQKINEITLKLFVLWHVTETFFQEPG
jgi:hypothetical protein